MQNLPRGLTQLGIRRCIRKLKETLKNNKRNPNFINDNTSCNPVPVPTSLGYRTINRLSGPCSKLTQGTSHGTKHQNFGQKRHFSLTRNCKDQNDCLNLGYPGLRMWQIVRVHWLSQEGAHPVLPSGGGFSTIHQLGIISPYLIRHRSIQLVKRFTYGAVSSGYASGSNVRLVDQSIKKVVCAPPRNPGKSLGILSLVVTFGGLRKCLH